MITLKTLSQATPQEVYDQIVNHLRNQGCKATRVYKGEVTCCYRAEDGKKCAAGCLIADDEYMPSFDERICKTWGNLVNHGYVPDKHFCLIIQMQIIHDAENIESWEKCFKVAARKFGLEYKGV